MMYVSYFIQKTRQYAQNWVEQLLNKDPSEYDEIPSNLLINPKQPEIYDGNLSLDAQMKCNMKR